MQISFDNTLVVIFDGKNVPQLLDFFTFNNLPTTIVQTDRDFWSKIHKAAEYSFDYVLTIDGHSNQIPEGFTELFSLINDNEIVIGKRQGNCWQSKVLNLMYGKLDDWFSTIRLYRIETLQSLSKYTFNPELEHFHFETLAKALELGCKIAEVDLSIKKEALNLSVTDFLKMALSVFKYKKSPTFNEQDLY